LEAEDGTGAIRIEFAKGTKDAQVYSPEELFAMILTHCKENGERHGSTKVSALELTVPMFFNHARRQGMADAAEIAGLTLLGLVDENGAGTLQYALERSFNETAQNVLIFNMGAASTQVSIVQITGGKDKRSGKEFRNIKVIAKAWDESLGVEDLDLALATQFAKEFDEKHPSADNKISNSPRAIVRLKKEARAIKEILSGLDKFPLSFASLHRDIDFKSQITRAQLEEYGKDVLARVRAPVERALKVAGMSINDVHLVEVIGGGFRVPGVRDSLRKVIPESFELSTHINGDEGMAFGAAYCAANVSATFHVPRLAYFQDALPREVRLVLKGQDLDRDVPLFPRFTLIEGKEPVRQVIKFRHDKDFTVSLVEKRAAEDDPADYPESTVIQQYEISGMSGAMSAFGKFGEPKVHLTFTVDRSMLIHMPAAEARFEEEYEEVVKPKANATAKDNSTETAEAATEEKPQTVKKIRKHSFVLLVKRTDADVPVKKMTAEAKLKAQGVLKQMDEADNNRARRDEAKNALEAFSFTTKEKLSTNEADVKLVIDPEALEQLISDLDKVEDWIYDHKDAQAEEFLAERARLAARVDKIFYLIRESQERPNAIKAFKKLLNSLEDRRGNWTQERPWISEAVWQAVDKAQEEARTWLGEMEKKQAVLTMRQDPVLTLSSIRAEIEKIQRLVELILKQRKPAPQQTTTTTEKKKSSSSKEEGEEKKSSEGEEGTKTESEGGEGAKTESEGGEGANTESEETGKGGGDQAEKEEL